MIARMLWLLMLAAALGGCCGTDDDASSSSTTLFEGLCKAGTNVAPQSGNWWNPQESGRGFFLDRQGDQLSVGAYVYDDVGAAVWYSGIAAKQSNGSYSGTLTRYQGGQTLTGAWRAPTASSAVATMRLEFANDSKGTLEVTLSDGSGTRATIPIEPYRANNQASKATFDNGTWWNEAESGRGFVIDVQGDTVMLAAFAYQEDGKPVWYRGTGSLGNSSSFTVVLNQTAEGQTLTGPYKSPRTLFEPVGSVSFQASSATTGTVTLPDGRKVAVKRFVF